MLVTVKSHRSETIETETIETEARMCHQDLIRIVVSLLYLSSQLTFTYSKSTIETLEKGGTYVPS